MLQVVFEQEKISRSTENSDGYNQKHLREWESNFSLLFYLKPLQSPELGSYP